MTILSLLLIAASSAHALNSYYEQSAYQSLNIECTQRVGFSEREYKEAKARGLDDADATDYGYAKSFDEKAYDQSMTADLRESVAFFLATTFEYSNNEQFCKEYRKQMVDQLKKFTRHQRKSSI
jgi:hypothetical protein